jgi:RNA polymerase sigma factor (sigma-70 family)
MKKEISESKLIDGIRRRDNTCFEYLYKSGYPLISGFVIQSGGTAEDVKDLLQDSLVIVYENIVDEKFRGDSGIMTYLNSICQNRWHTYLRRKKNILIDNYSNFMNLIYEDDPEEELAERAKYAESLLSASTDRCKEILVAFYYDNLSMEQIAGKLGYTNADNAKNQKAKCMDKLRKAVKSLATNEM